MINHDPTQIQKIQDTAYLSHDKKLKDVEQLHVTRDKYHSAKDNVAIAQQDLHKIKEMMTQAMHEEKLADLGHCYEIELSPAPLKWR